MIQQFRPSLNKQVISYVSKLFPSGITWDIYVRVDGHLFNPDDGKQPKTFGSNILIFFNLLALYIEYEVHWVDEIFIWRNSV